VLRHLVAMGFLDLHFPPNPCQGLTLLWAVARCASRHYSAPTKQRSRVLFGSPLSFICYSSGYRRIDRYLFFGEVQCRI
jgi:hypothetical protein